VYEKLYEIAELRKNHSGMETYEIAEGTGGGIGLRKNHSGMETTFQTASNSSSNPRCVRTIVVWKHLRSLSSRVIGGMCCVRTIVVWKHKEFSHLLTTFLSCVRTIVVWKLQRKRVRKSDGFRLRKNHSGMETNMVRQNLITVSHQLRKNHSGMETVRRQYVPYLWSVA